MSDSTLRSPADICAAAAGILGFAPTNSFVAYMLRRDITHGLLVRCAIRGDITITTEQAARFPATCNLHGNDAAVLLAVCDKSREAHARAVLDALRDTLNSAGIQVLRRVMTHDVTVEGQWYDPDSGERGPTYPYTDSLVTAHRVLSGERISRSRSDIEAEFSALAPAPAVDISNYAEIVTATAEEVTDALDGRPISPTLPTRAGVVITADVGLRDAMLYAALEHARSGADLWTHIARRLRGEPRGQALTIAAVCYCLLGDTIRGGIAAGIALDEAQAGDTPAPRLAGLLVEVLRAGLSPQQIRGALTKAAGSGRGTTQPSQD